jgi:hypothetical protein
MRPLRGGQRPDRLEAAEQDGDVRVVFVGRVVQINDLGAALGKISARSAATPGCPPCFTSLLG